MKQYLILIIVIGLLSACQKEPSFEGFWVGAAYELDTDYYTPIPNYLNAKADGVLEVGSVGRDSSNTLRWRQEKNKLYLDTNRLLQSHFHLSGDTFKFKNAYESVYFRANYTALSSIPTSTYFTNKSFASAYDRLEFANDSALLIENGSTVEKAFFSIWEKDGIYFMVKKGSAFDQDHHPRFTEQIVEIEEDHFSVKRWQNDAIQIVRYEMTETTNQLRADDFQLCNSYLYRGNPNHRYYYKDVFYKGGIYKIRKGFNAYFEPEDYSEIDGLLQLEFIVNCQGQAGRFSLKQFDLNFELTEFPPAFQAKIMAFGQSLQDWNPGKDKAGHQIDTYRFLNFKFKDGELVEIFP